MPNSGPDSFDNSKSIAIFSFRRRTATNIVIVRMRLLKYFSMIHISWFSGIFFTSLTHTALFTKYCTLISGQTLFRLNLRFRICIKISVYAKICQQSYQYFKFIFFHEQKQKTVLRDMSKNLKLNRKMFKWSRKNS